jgi:hypothetical protein
MDLRTRELQEPIICGRAMQQKGSRTDKQEFQGHMCRTEQTEQSTSLSHMLRLWVWDRADRVISLSCMSRLQVWDRADRVISLSRLLKHWQLLGINRRLFPM